MASLTLPTHKGWLVEWENGKTSTRGTKVIKCKDTLETTNMEFAEKVAKEKRRKGYEGVKIYECIF